MKELYVVIGVTGAIVSIHNNKEEAERKLKYCNKMASMYCKDGYACRIDTYEVSKSSPEATEWSLKENPMWR